MARAVVAERVRYAGLDEVGTGALAGPIVVVAVYFPVDDPPFPGIRDSKKCTPAQLRRLVPMLVDAAQDIGLGWASVPEINRLGASEAWTVAATRATSALQRRPLIIDGERHVPGYVGEQRSMPRADALVWSVAAASMIAKHLRDTEMMELDRTDPVYRWASNKGYGSAEHIAAIQRHGPSVQHRTQFIRDFMGPGARPAPSETDRAFPRCPRPAYRPSRLRRT